MKKILILVLLISSSFIYAQTTISGMVTDAQNNEAIPGAHIQVVGENMGTTADFDGNFSLTVSKEPPFELEASSVGFLASTVTITSVNQEVNFKLDEATELLDEVVISASRTPERIRESPVTIERMDAKMVENAATPDFYDGLENLKGVDVNTNSLTFKSVNTRGFATFSNTRFMQLVDGIDNASPALNFVLGNLVGMNELDVNTVEILPGASSALYGANAFNGILFMTSKSPFEHTGISTYAKVGQTAQEVAGDHRFYDYGIRAAYKFSDKFAGKVNFSYMRGTDWMSADYNQYYDVLPGESSIITPFAERGNVFDGLNIYGDEITASDALPSNGIPNMETLGYMLTGVLLPEGTIGDVSMTGFNEMDLTDYQAKSIKTDVGLHYKPWGNDKELIFNFRSGRGNTIYQGANRYYLKDFVMNQTKLEFKGDNFFVRGYMTTEDAGDSYDMRFAGINMNKQFAGNWFGAYAQGFIGAIAAGADTETAHMSGRETADTYVTPQVGTPEFEALFNQVTTDPDLNTGAKFIDKSKMQHVDANYNFSNFISEWADLQLGGSFRKYILDSQGTIFTDYDAPIKYDEYGAYAQLSKKFADDRLKFTGSVRYDKAQNFDGSFSPRVAFVYSVGENLNHNLRASFQTGFRNPTTQDQYIGLDVGQAILVGSAEDNLNRYTSKPLSVSSKGQALGFPASVTLSGARAYDNAFSYSSLLDFGDAVEAAIPAIMEAIPGISLDDATQLAAAQSANVLKKSNVDYVQPEHVNAYELGYRGKVGSVNLDISGYFNQYEGFISTKTVIAPLYGDISSADFNDVENSQMAQVLLAAIGSEDYQPFQVYTNSAAEVSSYGGTLGLNTGIGKFDLGANYTFANFNFDQATDPDYEAGFNTPKHKVKVSLGSEELFKNFGFGVNYRWQDEFLWEANIANAMIPARSVIDAQINYSVPSLKSVLKVGGTNIGGDDYLVAPASGKIGQQYYVSWTINP